MPRDARAAGGARNVPFGGYYNRAAQNDDPLLTATVRINGEERGRGTTKEMIHSYEDIIAYISRNETPHAGELIGTGTLGGCCALETGHWPKDGDVIEIDVDKIGVLRNRVRRARK